MNYYYNDNDKRSMSAIIKTVLLFYTATMSRISVGICSRDITPDHNGSTAIGLSLGLTFVHKPDTTPLRCHISFWTLSTHRVFKGRNFTCKSSRLMESSYQCSMECRLPSQHQFTNELLVSKPNSTG